MVYETSKFDNLLKPVNVYILRGIPASGKSTWAKEMVRKGKGKVKRVNRDDLRSMIDDSVFSRKSESHINALRNIVISYYIEAGCDVIVDDTNVKTSYVKDLVEYVERLRPNANVVVKLFNTPLDVCLERNAKRTGRAKVPEDIVRKFYKSLTDSLSNESGEEFGCVTD